MHYGDNKPKYMRYAIYVFAVIIVSLLQNSRGALPEIFGARAMVAIPFCIAIAMYEREISAAVLGAFSGILLDVCGVRDGFNTLVLMLLAVVCSLLISRVMQNNIVTATVLSAGAVAVYFILYITVNFIFTGTEISLKSVIGFYGPSFIYTMVFVPFFYYISGWIYKTHKTADE